MYGRRTERAGGVQVRRAHLCHHVVSGRDLFVAVELMISWKKILQLRHPLVAVGEEVS